MGDRRKFEDDLAYWSRRRTDARTKIREIDVTRDKLKELTAAYDKIFARACNAFAEADRHVAELEGKVKKVPIGMSGRKQRKVASLIDPRLLDKNFLAELIKQLEVDKKEV